MQMFIFCAIIFILPLVGSISVMPVVKISDLWIAKEFLVVLSIIFLFSYEMLRNRQIKFKCDNPYISWFLIFLVINIYNAPQIILPFGYQNLGSLWLWKTGFWIALYYLFYINVKMMRIKEQSIVSVFCWVAIIQSAYAILQYFNLDQFQVIRSYEEIGGPVAPGVTAMIGNPTYLGCFLGILFPFIMCYSAWYLSIFVFVAIVLTGSIFAIGGSVLTVIFMVCLYRGKKWLIALFSAIALVVMFIFSNWATLKDRIVKESNGRIPVWEQTIEDWKAPPLLIPIDKDDSKEKVREIEVLNKRTNCLTGRGAGSFPYLFSAKHKTSFDDPHCVYLRVLYEYGVIGLFLFIGILFSVFYKNFRKVCESKFKFVLYSSLFFICISSVGIPMLNIEPLRFFCVLIFILLSI